MKREEFWVLCDSIMGMETQKPTGIRRRTRWNNRDPGSGRYPGFGLIRHYSSELIHISSKDYGNKLFKSEEDAVAFLKSIVG